MSVSRFRIDYLIFGYRRLSVSENDIALAANILMNAGVFVAFSSDGRAILPLRSAHRACRALDGRCKYSISAQLGIPGALYSARGRFGTFFAIIAAALFFIISSNVVWDVRVEGEELPKSAVIEELQKCGFGVGSSWKTDLSAIEGAVVLNSDRISWININRRGTVAYVEVRPKLTYTEEQKPEYANVIAKEDGIVEEIRVKGGVALVKAGETVRRGQLLISGAIPDEFGGGFTLAEGVVRARVEREISVSVPRSESVRAEGERRLCGVRVNILGFLINIFKTYGNPCEVCDIIEEIDNLTIFGRYRMPIKIIKSYEVRCEFSTVSYTDEQLTKIAASRLAAKTELMLSGGDLVSISTGGEFTDSGYRMYSRIVAVVEIGISNEFKIEGN